MNATRSIVRRWLPTAALLGLGLLASGAREAQAGFTVFLTGGAPAAGPGSNFTYNYTVTTTADDNLTSGDFFRIYDFGGLVGTPTAPAGWSAAVANSNPTPPPNVILSHGDDPAVPNITYTYNGASTPGPLTLTGFSAVSTFGATGIKNFAGRISKLDGGSPGSPVDSTGDVVVPAGVPEPASLISGAIGLALVGLGYARRNRKV